MTTTWLNKWFILWNHCQRNGSKHGQTCERPPAGRGNSRQVSWSSNLCYAFKDPDQSPGWACRILSPLTAFKNVSNRAELIRKSPTLKAGAKISQLGQSEQQDREASPSSHQRSNEVRTWESDFGISGSWSPRASKATRAKRVKKVMDDWRFRQSLYVVDVRLRETRPEEALITRGLGIIIYKSGIHSRTSLSTERRKLGQFEFQFYRAMKFKNHIPVQTQNSSSLEIELSSSENLQIEFHKNSLKMVSLTEKNAHSLFYYI